MVMLIPYIIIGILAGGLFGFVGTGAGLVIIPALVIFAHFSEKTAIGTSITLLLPPIGVLAAATYWKHGNVNTPAALIIGIGFLVGSFFAARIAINMPDLMIERVFGVVAVLIGFKMLFSS